MPDDKKRTPAEIVKGMETRLERDLATWIFQAKPPKSKAMKLTEDIASWIAGDVDVDEDGS